MKKLFFTIALLLSCAARADIPIESDAIEPQKINVKLATTAAAMVREAGWHCDSVSAFRSMAFTRGYVLVCNGFKYEYEIVDRGGNWVATLK